VTPASDRQHERIGLALEVSYRTAGAFLVSYSVNLSKGGIFLETNTPLPIGTELGLRFNVPGVDGTIDVRGVVAWVRAVAADDRPPGMGVEFENLDGRYGAIIDHIVAGFSGLRVLVMAKQAPTRALLSRGVRSILSAADVVEAADADAAEAACAKGPDLAVIDLDESDADGLLTLRLAKRSATHPIPVIVTARDVDARRRARDLGADENLPSPPALPELQQAIVRALGRPLRVA
jgi:type IV pilus assembly protein PilZ